MDIISRFFFFSHHELQLFAELSNYIVEKSDCRAISKRKITRPKQEFYPLQVTCRGIRLGEIQDLASVQDWGGKVDTSMDTECLPRYDTLE